MSHARGMTMLEVLLALTLLSTVSVAVATWLEISGRMSRDVDGQVAWERSAAAALRQIESDLLVGDLRQREDEPRVEVIPRGVRIRTRATGIGSVTREYVLEPEESRLVRRDASSRSEERLLLVGVEAIACGWDEAEEILSVELVSDRGRTMGRRCRAR
jgi:prepilin-type N-terminal cleavage/methylation domain-containing protein